MAAGRTETISLPDGSRYDAYIVGESGTGRPAVLIFTPIYGVGDDLKSVADRWAADGFLVAVPDYFFAWRPGSWIALKKGERKP